MGNRLTEEAAPPSRQHQGLGPGKLMWLFFSMKGRISIPTWWFCQAAIVVAIIAFQLLILPVLGGVMRSVIGPDARMIVPVLAGLAFPVALLASLAVSGKRYHDRDKSEWWALVVLVPAIGVVWQGIECGVLAGTTGENRFGPMP